MWEVYSTVPLCSKHHEAALSDWEQRREGLDSPMAELQGVFPNLGCPGNNLVVYIGEVPDVLYFVPQMLQQAKQNIEAAVHTSMTCTGRSVSTFKLQSLLAAAMLSGARWVPLGCHLCGSNRRL